jgi:hypothetical protein
VTWVAAVSVVSRALLLLVPGLIESVVSERYHHPLYVDIECYILIMRGHDENAQNHCKVKPDRREACGKNNANTANEITLSWQKQRKSGPQCNCHLHHPRLGNSASQSLASGLNELIPCHVCPLSHLPGSSLSTTSGRTKKTSKGL